MPVASLEMPGVLQADTQATLRRLSPVTLMAVLRSDNLRVPSEMHVFNSVVSWLEADSTRLEQVCCLRDCYVPSSSSASLLAHCIHSPAVCSCWAAQELICDKPAGGGVGVQIC